MFDNNFDPYNQLQELEKNQKVLFRNDQEICKAIEGLHQALINQQHIIDTLQKGLDTANKANEMLLQQAVASMSQQFSSQGQH